MLGRILLAVESPAIEARFRQLADRPDTVVEAVRSGESLWETVSRENFDLVLVGRDRLPEPAAETVSSLRTLPESPDVVVLCDEEDAEQRAGLLAAGCLSVLYTGLSNRMLEDALSAVLDRRLQAAGEALVTPASARLPQLSDFI